VASLHVTVDRGRRRYDLSAFGDRELVMACLHWNGALRFEIGSELHSAVRSLADGFGPNVTEPDMFWDWSHVRDSSDEAFVAMAKALRVVLEAKCWAAGDGCVPCPHRDYCWR
jgi:hypothetical protein